MSHYVRFILWVIGIAGSLHTGEAHTLTWAIKPRLWTRAGKNLWLDLSMPNSPNIHELADRYSTYTYDAHRF